METTSTVGYYATKEEALAVAKETGGKVRHSRLVARDTGLSTWPTFFPWAVVAPLSR